MTRDPDGAPTLSLRHPASRTASGLSRILGFSWYAGGVRALGNGTFTNALLDFAGLKDAVLTGLRLTDSKAALPIVIGTGSVSVKPCENVSIVDSRQTDVATTTTAAVTFQKAINCGVTRGAITGLATGSDFYAATVTTDSQGCYVEGVDLGDHSTNAKLPAGAFSAADVLSGRLRLRGNFGSTQINPIELGTPIDATIVSNAITVASSNVRITAGTGPLKTISGGTAGDMLVLTASTSINVAKATGGGSGGGNIQLAAATRPLDNAKDTLTLLSDGTDWLEMSFSNNG